MVDPQVAPRLIATRVPWAAALIAALAGAAQAIPGAAGALEYDRTLVGHGEVWRLFTAQAVHWSWPMAGVDLTAAFLAGLLVEMRSRTRFLITVAVSAVAVGLAVQFLATGVARYRGLSGVATALVVVAGLDLFAERARSARALAAVALVLLLAKIAVEGITGRSIFAGTLPAGVHLAPEAHVAGALAGALVWAGNALRKHWQLP